MGADRIVTPGEKVGEIEQFRPGSGVCEHGGSLIATLVGHLQSVRGSGTGNEGGKKSDDDKPELTVLPFRPATAMPSVGGRVTAKIVRVTPRAAHAEVIAVEGMGITVETFKGMIRQQDVRQTEVDKVEIYKCFAPGDVVRADVISLGDRHHYYLSTAKNELGVIYAKSRAGVPMIPINWQEMQCPATKTKEPRKVAKQ